MKEYIAPALAILLLTGLWDNLFNGHLFVTAVIGAIYFLGSFALYVVSESHNERRSHIIFVAYLTVLIAYFSLEALFKEMYGG